MKTKDQRRSQNVEDRRGVPRGAIGGGIGAVIVAILGLLLSGGNFTNIIEIFTGQDNPAPYTESAEDQLLADFSSVVLAETEDIWTWIFQQQNIKYTYPTLVLYSGQVDSACGSATSAIGPFYCPGDQKVYLDLSFFSELKDRFQAPGDFAMAYVIAHEVGHHVQTLLGITQQMDSLRAKLSPTEYNKYSVRYELQADYLAGVWANHANRMKLLDQGDLEEALNAASAIGDDRIQKNTQGYAIPDSFTHGTSAQRSAWFYQGFLNGTLSGGDTFNLHDP
ncbi:MAG: neutral zinc metallopeptidase [Dehalogenimonas sp.]